MELEAESIDAAEDALGVGMDPDELHGEVSKLIELAVNVADDELSSHRRTAIRYYRGKKDIVDYEEGRSTIVSMDLMEAVNAYMPSIMRIFHGSDRAVEFEPTRPGGEDQAEQATDYVDHVYLIDNNGELVTWTAVNTALYQLFGVTKVWWDDAIDVKTHHFTGLTEQAYRALLMEPDVEAVAAESYPHPDLTEEQLSQFLQMGQVPELWDCEIRRKTKRRQARVAAVPPDEFLIDPWAKDFDSAIIIGQRTYRSVSDMVAMGYDRSVVDEYTSQARDAINTERQERQRFNNTLEEMFTSEKVLHTEVYVRIDYDGDGIAELRKIDCVGESYEILSNEPWDEHGFSLWRINPEPFTIFGFDLHDTTKDIQRVQTALMRATMDSAYLSLNPRPTVLAGQTDMDSVADTSLGAIGIEYVPNAIRYATVPFVGRDALPIMEKLESKKEDRIGVSKASAGLNADALQSSTAMAVNATVQGGQQKIELAARSLAYGYADMMAKLYRLIVKNQDQARTVKLRGRWADIDPTVWETDLAVRINVALGSGQKETKIQQLQMLTQMQQQIMERLGPQNPLVGLGNIRYTLGKIVELMGYQDSGQFYKRVPVDFEMPPQPPQPDPGTILAEAQAKALEIQGQIDMARLQLDTQKAAATDDRERDRLDSQNRIEAAKIQLKGGELGIDLLDRVIAEPRN